MVGFFCSDANFTAIQVRNEGLEAKVVNDALGMTQDFVVYSPPGLQIQIPMCEMFEGMCPSVPQISSNLEHTVLQTNIRRVCAIVLALHHYALK